MRHFFPELRKRIRLLLFGVAGPEASRPTIPQAAPQESITTPPSGPKPGRPISAALSRTIDAVKRNPAVTPAELASMLSVSPSYARTLLRRARARQPEPVPCLRPAPPTDFQRAVHDLNARLTETENHLAALRSVPLHGRTSMNLNRRAEVLRLAESGESAPAIAEALGIPPGEVEFTLKIDRLLTSAVQSR